MFKTKQNYNKRKISRSIKKLKIEFDKRFKDVKFSFEDIGYQIIITWINGTSLEKVDKLIKNLNLSGKVNENIIVMRLYSKQLLSHCISEWKKENPEYKNLKIEDDIKICRFRGAYLGKKSEEIKNRDEKEKLANLYRKVMDFAEKIEGYQFDPDGDNLKFKLSDYNNPNNKEIVEKDILRAFQEDGIEVQGVSRDENGMMVIKL